MIGFDICHFVGKSENLVCKVENGKEYPILWTKKTEEDTHPLSYGKNLVGGNSNLMGGITFEFSDTIQEEDVELAQIEMVKII